MVKSVEFQKEGNGYLYEMNEQLRKYNEFLTSDEEGNINGHYINYKLWSEFIDSLSDVQSGLVGYSDLHSFWHCNYIPQIVIKENKEANVYKTPRIILTPHILKFELDNNDEKHFCGLTISKITYEDVTGKPKSEYIVEEPLSEIELKILRETDMIPFRFKQIVENEFNKIIEETGWLK